MLSDSWWNSDFVDLTQPDSLMVHLVASRLYIRSESWHNAHLVVNKSIRLLVRLLERSGYWSRVLLYLDDLFFFRLYGGLKLVRF